MSARGERGDCEECTAFFERGGRWNDLVSKVRNGVAKAAREMKVPEATAWAVFGNVANMVVTNEHTLKAIMGNMDTQNPKGTVADALPGSVFFLEDALLLFDRGSNNKCKDPSTHTLGVFIKAAEAIVHGFEVVETVNRIGEHGASEVPHEVITLVRHCGTDTDALDEWLRDALRDQCTTLVRAFQQYYADELKENELNGEEKRCLLEGWLMKQAEEEGTRRRSSRPDGQPPPPPPSKGRLEAVTSLWDKITLLVATKLGFADAVLEFRKLIARTVEVYKKRTVQLREMDASREERSKRQRQEKK